MKSSLRVDRREADLDTLIRDSLDTPQVVTVEGVPVAVVMRYSEYVELVPEVDVKPESLYAFLRSIPDFEIPARDKSLARERSIE